MNKLRLALLPALFLLTAASPAELRQWRDQAARVTIVRDDWGIAHVRGRTDADAVFGMIYAQAEDDFPRIEANYLTALGRTAEAEGEKAIWQDLRARLYMQPDDLKAQLQQIRAGVLVASPDVARRLDAAQTLAGSLTPATRSLVAERLRPAAEGGEDDPAVRSQLEIALKAIDTHLAWGERLGVLFTGVSLGSILLLVALGDHCIPAKARAPSTSLSSRPNR